MKTKSVIIYNFALPGAAQWLIFSYWVEIVGTKLTPGIQILNHLNLPVLNIVDFEVSTAFCINLLRLNHSHCVQNGEGKNW